MGKPSVVNVKNFDSTIENEEELLRLAASVERGSEHPVGRAIVKEAEQRGMNLFEPQAFKATRGQGVQARVNGLEIRVGKPDWCDDVSEVTQDDARVQTCALQDEGKTVMNVMVDGKLAGLIAVADTLKPESKEAIGELHKQKLQVVMITGDNMQTAKAIASEVDIDEIFAGVRPEEKSAKIKELQQKDKKVGMVGDGINDAPALAQADVGVAIGTGTDVAIETGDVILASGNLLGVSKAIELSRATMRTIKQNLFWAFFYNVALIPLAAGVLYPFESLPWVFRQLHPILAALAMAVSSITVVSNSLRLYRAKIK
jgi:Cu+-exporting ATPase